MKTTRKVVPIKCPVCGELRGVQDENQEIICLNCDEVVISDKRNHD